MTIKELYRGGQYYKLLEEHLSEMCSLSIKKIKKWTTDKVDDLLCVIKSCVFCGAYAELLELLENLKKWCIVNGYLPKTDYFEYELIALIYYLFNLDDYQLYLDVSELKNEDIVTLENKIGDIISKVIKGHEKTKTEIDERVKSLIQVFRDYGNGLLPFYTVEYLYPYKPPFGEGTLDLTGCGNYVSLTIKKVPREKDVFTSFSFRINGYTNGDSFWEGHSWMHKERLPVVRKTLRTLNHILLRGIRAIPGKFVPLYTIEQVSSSSVSVYTNDGTPIHQTIFGTHFDASWVGGNVPEVEFTEEQFNILSSDIKNYFGCNHFYIQYLQALNCKNAGLYVESFLLFCTCVESMIYYWCRRIAKLMGKEKQYEVFSSENRSKCDKCELYMKAENVSKPDKGMPPNAFVHIDFLKEECNVTEKDVKELKSLFSKARNDSLRNDVIHGRTNRVLMEMLVKTEFAILGIEKVFLRIEKSKL